MNNRKIHGGCTWSTMKEIKPRRIPRQEANRYCFCNYGKTLDGKLEEVCQKWLDKLEDIIIKEGAIGKC